MSRAGGRVLDPFAGSGTTLVQALESGYDATGVDIAGFNALLARVKTRPYNLDALTRDLLWAHAQAEAFEPSGTYPSEASDYVRAWYAPTAAEELLHFRSLVEQVGSADVLRVVLARSARSARRTAAFRSRVPARAAARALLVLTSTGGSAGPSKRRAGSCCATRSTRSTGSRPSPASEPRAGSRGCFTATLATIDLEGPYDGVITSPPYPGLIDYHEQHRYAYELLGVDERRDLELGRPARGTGRAAIEEYVEGVADGARERPVVARARWSPVHRRQRSPRPLSARSCDARGSVSSTATSAT